MGTIFKEGSGKVSSKRVMGIAILIFCVMSFTVDQFTSFKMNDIAFSVLAGAGSGLLGLGIYDNKYKNTLEG